MIKKKINWKMKMQNCILFYAPMIHIYSISYTSFILGYASIVLLYTRLIIYANLPLFSLPSNESNSVCNMFSLLEYTSTRCKVIYLLCHFCSILCSGTHPWQLKCLYFLHSALYQFSLDSQFSLILFVPSCNGLGKFLNGK